MPLATRKVWILSKEPKHIWQQSMISEIIILAFNENVNIWNIWVDQN